MKNTELNQYFEANSDEINKLYFESLLKKNQDKTLKNLTIANSDNDSKVYPYAILDKKELMPVTHYKDLMGEGDLESVIRVIKMHAGLGSSVKRKKYLKEKTGRTKLGSKGTDLFIGDKSLAELQIEQISILNKKAWTKKVQLQNLVNEETREIVEKLNADFMLPSLVQYKMPTLKEDKELSTERLAPGGHAFLGFLLLHEIFKEPSDRKEILTIGNGEDLNSTPDHKILTWMERNEIPICMITTTKTVNDKKGGQLAVVTEATPYLTIVEKAQAEKADQLKYFEELGLREGDDISLFNTNIVLINRHVISKHLSMADLSEKDFLNLITPDLIKNEKEQDGVSYTQLEGAIASVMLNLDRFFREKFNQPLIRFLNLTEEEREEFFIPIKTMADFESVLERYDYNNDTGRLVLK